MASRSKRGPRPMLLSSGFRWNRGATFKWRRGRFGTTLMTRGW